MKKSRQKIGRTCVWLAGTFALMLALHLASLRTARAEAPLLVVEVTELDHLAAQRFLSLTEQPSQLVRLSEGREPERALALARSAGAQQVVVFDQAIARVVVLRTTDGASFIRNTDGDAATPFMAAFVAVELLALSHGAAPKTQHEAPAAPRWSTRWLALAAGVDVLTRAPSQAAARPLLGLLGAFGYPDSPWSLLLGVSVAPHARSEQPLGSARLQLTRTDLTLRAGSLWQHDRLGVSTFAQAGALWIDARYRSSTAVRDEARHAFVAGIGAEPSLLLWPWLRLVGSAVLQTSAKRGEYRASGAASVRDPAVGIALGLGLWLTLPIQGS